MRVARKYLVEAKVTPDFIKDGLNFIRLINKKRIRVLDWDGKENYEIDFPGETKRWYSLKNAINKLLIEL